MKELVRNTAVAGASGFFVWMFTKLQTRRERKKNDLQTLHESTANLVDSIRILTGQNGNLVKELLEEQQKYLELLREKSEWTKERSELLAKIENLEKQIETLSKKIDNINKKKQKYETNINN